MKVNTQKIHEFIFDENNKYSVELEIEYQVVNNKNNVDKMYQTLINLPFSTKSSWTKTEYKDKEERAIKILSSALKSKYSTIKKRDFANQQRYNKFKRIVNLKEKKDLKLEYSYGINHREPHDTIGGKRVSDICKELNEVTDLIKEEESDIKFELTWNKLIQMLLVDNCAYCGISMKQINELSLNKKLFTKRSRGYSLEVDQINPYGNYTDKNCVACCYWCNNAKTDEFSAYEFKEIARGIHLSWKCRSQGIKNFNLIDFNDILFWKDIENDCK